MIFSIVLTGIPIAHYLPHALIAIRYSASSMFTDIYQLENSTSKAVANVLTAIKKSIQFLQARTTSSFAHAVNNNNNYVLI